MLIAASQLLSAQELIFLLTPLTTTSQLETISSETVIFNLSAMLSKWNIYEFFVALQEPLSSQTELQNAHKLCGLPPAQLRLTGYKGRAVVQPIFDILRGWSRVSTQSTPQHEAWFMTTETCFPVVVQCIPVICYFLHGYLLGAKHQMCKPPIVIVKISLLLLLCFLPLGVCGSP